MGLLVAPLLCQLLTWWTCEKIRTDLDLPWLDLILLDLLMNLWKNIWRTYIITFLWAQPSFHQWYVLIVSLLAMSTSHLMLMNLKKKELGTYHGFSCELHPPLLAISMSAPHQMNIIKTIWYLPFAAWSCELNHYQCWLCPSLVLLAPLLMNL